VRLIGFGVGALGDNVPRPRQLDLFDLSSGAPSAPSAATELRRGRQSKLEHAADGIRRTFGSKSLRRARTLPPPPPRAKNAKRPPRGSGVENKHGPGPQMV
jgi:hypothetical protein